jgi:hypothetical protein
MRTPGGEAMRRLLCAVLSVAADCFDTRRAILLKHSVNRLAAAGQYVYSTPGTPAGGVLGR